MPNRWQLHTNQPCPCTYQERQQQQHELTGKLLDTAILSQWHWQHSTFTATSVHVAEHGVTAQLWINELVKHHIRFSSRLSHSGIVTPRTSLQKSLFFDMILPPRSGSPAFTSSANLLLHCPCHRMS
jgi:hypothetical protein